LKLDVLNTDELVFFLLDYIMNNLGLFIFVYLILCRV
jgi:hypothetical protein